MNKPYHRIWRPLKNGQKAEYLDDELYASTHYQASNSYNLIENDLKKIFEFIEPVDENLNIFSHRIYELFLRSCTEYESHCKDILLDNGLKGSFNNEKYFLINIMCKLSEYSAMLLLDGNIYLNINPFKDWANVDYEPLKWYQDYNSVKHNRNSEFSKANLSNLINSVCAVQILLIAQFHKNALYFNNKNQPIFEVVDENLISFDSSIFFIKLPVWNENEKYDFNWNMICNSNDRISKYFEINEN